MNLCGCVGWVPHFLKKMVKDYDCDMRHGGPYDRGSVDAYYGRNCDPHYFIGATYSTDKVERKDMTNTQVEEYLLGYNEQLDRKIW